MPKKSNFVIQCGGLGTGETLKDLVPQKTCDSLTWFRHRKDLERSRAKESIG